MPQAIVFDFRDTLIAVKAAYVQANELLFQKLKELGLKMDAETFEEDIKPVINESKALYAMDPHHHDGTSIFIHKTLEALKFPVPHETFIELSVAYDKKFAQSVSLYSDADIILPRLRAAGLKLAVVIDGTVLRERRILELLNLENAFDVVVISEEVGENKLSVKPLWTALERLRVPPAGVVVIGDQEDRDIKHAKELGCRAVRLAREGSRHANELQPTVADATVHSLLEFERLIRSWTFAHVPISGQDS